MNDIFTKKMRDSLLPHLPIGSLIESFNPNVPMGFLKLEPGKNGVGKEINRKQYSDLFEVIHTIYGEGDGINTFNLPREEDCILKYPSIHRIPNCLEMYVYIKYTKD